MWPPSTSPPNLPTYSLSFWKRPLALTNIFPSSVLTRVTQLPSTVPAYIVGIRPRSKHTITYFQTLEVRLMLLVFNSGANLDRMTRWCLPSTPKLHPKYFRVLVNLCRSRCGGHHLFLYGHVQVFHGVTPFYWCGVCA